MWWRVSIISLAYFMLGAHFLRFGQTPFAVVYGLAPLLLFVPHLAMTRLLQTILAISALLIWAPSTVDFISMRMSAGAPWIRLSLIMLSVMVFTLYAAWSANGIIARRHK